MYSKLKLMICYFLILSLLFVCAPLNVSASAADEKAELIKDMDGGRAEIVDVLCGNQISDVMCEELGKRNIFVDDDTLVELVRTDSGDATAVVFTNTDGDMISKSILVAVAEDGQLRPFAASDLSGGSATVDPFDDSFYIVFMVSFYAYQYSTDWQGIVQPQTAMFIYHDPDRLYTVKRLVMNYDCYGVGGYFDGTTFTPITGPLDNYHHRITVNRVNPDRSTYYSTTNPISSNMAIQLFFEPGGLQQVAYTITVVRNSDQSEITRSLYVPLTTYP